MKILSIDTASNICTVSVLEDNKCIKELVVNDSRNHSEKIMPAIEKVLEETKIEIKDINLIVCDKGPGSFTGIRIGVGTVLAFRDSINVECIGISSLEALAYNTNNEGLICTLIDAKNSNVYYGLFQLKDETYSQIGELEFKTINEVIYILKQYSSPITFVGDGAIINKEYITENINVSKFCENNNLSSISLGIAGFNAYKSNRETSIMPLYLRKSQAERALEEKGGNN
ncbi:MAG: tRNA (adenosine(37)-N6)-threonylcarbamoyltransferase complex dimerization subunit type 1 TsaB [Clostridia bacterium]|jgi:tRNA threonylcarbamoyladenosine biosynthesis protein TsaB|nr:tRNA (adenosine(37)-N6)-threonylcarbamoyltransferase complex dimerization subunit type 1 TsaB [Clostridia bacterium]